MARGVFGDSYQALRNLRFNHKKSRVLLGLPRRKADGNEQEAEGRVGASNAPRPVAREVTQPPAAYRPGLPLGPLSIQNRVNFTSATIKRPRGAAMRKRTERVASRFRWS